MDDYPIAENALLAHIIVVSPPWDLPDTFSACSGYSTVGIRVKAVALSVRWLGATIGRCDSAEEDAEEGDGGGHDGDCDFGTGPDQ
jgi:hypothetical protein